MDIEKKLSVSFLIHPEDDEPHQISYPIEMLDLFRLGTQVDLDNCPILKKYCVEWERETASLEWLTVENVSSSTYVHNDVLVCAIVAHLTRDNHCQNCGFPIS